MVSSLKHLLIVEDDPHDLELSKWPCRVSLAGGGREALELLHQPGPPPDLVLLDLNMPGVGGREVLGAIRGDARLRAVPVVMFTTSAEPGDRAACISAGADGYVVKPDGLGRLIQTLHTLGQCWLPVEDSTPGGGWFPSAVILDG